MTFYIPPSPNLMFCMYNPYYPNYNAWYPLSSCYSDMCQASPDSILILRMQQKIQQASLDSILRAQKSKLNACIATRFNELSYDIDTTLYYADNIPYYGLNEDLVIEEPKKKKLTIYDLARLVFPDDPIRDYVEKKVAEIEERYRWIDEFY